MGAGKTTLGRALASDLNISFCDLDQYIENRYMKSVNRIFAEYGEDGFRRIESGLLHEVGEFEDVIISCGGSTPLFFDNMDYMKRQGVTVWLDASVPVLLRRLKVARSGRPLIAAMNDSELETFITGELGRRSVCYCRAQFRYDGDSLESAAQISKSVSGLRSLLNL